MEETRPQQHLSAAKAAHEMLERVKTESTGILLRQKNIKTTRLLQNLKESLNSMADLRRAKKYGESINKLQSQAELPRFVIGVLGGTGTGKSSLINAVLDQDRVVPTNCMRACTAVITEILWNASDDPKKKYRAEIEFLTQAEWTQELLQLHRDILDSDGKISKDTKDHSSDAGAAYTILRSVYPDLAGEELELTHPTALASQEGVRQVLGKTVSIEEKKGDVFYNKIQSYVDSEDNNSSGTSGNSQPASIAYWPLIKVVRVFLKSKVLSTGVVLVDMPGNQDTNNVRANVAAKYAKECTRLWVVAPITRAVNDKTAKNLMGEHFKQQLKYDDSYSNITFICTKADDISMDEAPETLGIKDVISDMHKRCNRIESEIDSKKKNLKRLEAKKAKLHANYKVTGNDVNTWQGIYNDAVNGERALAPPETPQKRKRQEAETTRKRRKADEDSSATEDSSDESDADELSQEDNERKPLTAEDANAKLQELKKMKKSLKEEKKQVIEQLKDLKTSIADLTAEGTTLYTEMHRMCIKGRNDYSREAIQKDFALGLKELDEELLATQREGDQQELDTTDTDYEKIGRDLPVFCISSRGYQQLRGRMKKDRRVAGFTSPEETGIPGLQQHMLEFAATIQDNYSKHQLSEVCRLLRGMNLFLAGDDALLKMSDAERDEECQHLQKLLAKLGKTIRESITSCMEDCEKAALKVLTRLPRAADKASAEAVAMARSWGADHDSGGLRFPTYRATCRRRGVFKGAAGPRDFNEDLLKPMKNCTANSWNKAFNKRFPELLDHLALSCAHLISAFHDGMRARRFLVENSDLVQGILDKHIAATNETLLLIAQKHKKLAKGEQRGANRAFYPAVEGSLRTTYSDCAQVRGRGALVALRETMETQVEEKRHTMFIDAAREADDAVHKLLEGLGDMIHNNIDNVISTMEEDYTALIGTAATEADNRDRKMLQPVLESFYQKLLIALNEPEDIATAPDVVECEDVDDDSSYHESD